MKQVRQQTNLPAFQWIGLAVMSLLMLFLPYKAGLYNAKIMDYENPLLVAMILTFILVCFSVPYLLPRWTLNSFKAILSIWALFIPLCYFISSFYAVSTHNAHISFLVTAMCSAFFVLGLYYADGITAQKFLSGALAASAYAIVLFGVLNMFGQVYSLDALWFTQGQYRLTSVFQYSNTYAGFLSACLLVGFYFVVTSKRWYWQLVHSFMLIIICVSIALTFSRGALVIIPLLILLYLCLLRVREQLLSILSMLITSLLTLTILGKINGYYHEIASIVQPQGDQHAHPISIFHATAWKAWLLLLAACLMNFALHYAVHRWLVPWTDRRFPKLPGKPFWWIPAAAVGLALLAAILVSMSDSITKLLPADIAGRIESIGLRQHSVLERGTFYADAWKIVKDHPFGVGGGGWSDLYKQYQNNPYISTEIHSHPLQVLVEIGWIGFLLMAGFILFAYILYIRNYWKTREKPSSHFIFFLFSLCLLIHSFIDFDMTFGYIGILYFVCLGAMLAPFSSQLLIARWERYKPSKSRYAYPAIIGVFALIVLIWSVKEYNANRNYNRAIEMATVEQQGLDQIMVPLDKAISSSPANPTFAHRKIDWLTQGYQSTKDKTYLNEVYAEINRIEKYDHNNEKIVMDKFQYFKDIGDTGKSLAAMDEAVTKFQWDINYYQMAIQEYAAAGNEQSWKRGLELYDEVLKKIEHLKTLPKEQLQGRPFEITPEIQQAVDSIRKQLNK